VFDDYAFDVRGFVLVRGALAPDEIARARQAVESDGSDLTWLARTSAVASRVGELCTGMQRGGIPPLEPQLACPPRLLTDEGPCFRGGGAQHERSVAYLHRGGVRSVCAVRAVWALDDAGSSGSVTLVPASHRAALDAPEPLLSGEDDLACFGESLYHRPELQSGDLLLFSSALLHSVRAGADQRLVGAEFVNGWVSLSGERADRATSRPWEGSVSPELRALLLFDEHEDSPAPLPSVLSDGKSLWLGDQQHARQDHPRVLAPVTDNGVDPAEAFAWELNGYLVLRNVLSREQLAAAHAALDSQREQLMATREHVRQAVDAADAERVQRDERSIGEPGPLSPRGGQWPDGSPHSDKLKGYPRMDIGELLTLPLPHSLPFREMATLPAVLHTLTWMMGPAFKLGCVGHMLRR
jgi:hypothetical protein